MDAESAAEKYQIAQRQLGLIEATQYAGISTMLPTNAPFTQPGH